MAYYLHRVDSTLQVFTLPPLTGDLHVVPCPFWGSPDFAPREGALIHVGFDGNGCTVGCSDHPADLHDAVEIVTATLRVKIARNPHLNRGNST